MLRALLLGAATVIVSTLLSGVLALLIVERRLSFEGFPPAILLAPAPLVLIGLIVVGLPVDWMLRRFEVRNPLAYAGLGTAGGFLLGIAMTLGEALWVEPFALLGAGYGLVTALVFWTLFRRWRRSGEEPG